MASKMYWWRAEEEEQNNASSLIYVYFSFNFVIILLEKLMSLSITNDTNILIFNGISNELKLTMSTY